MAKNAVRSRSLGGLKHGLYPLPTCTRSGLPQGVVVPMPSGSLCPLLGLHPSGSFLTLHTVKGMAHHAMQHWQLEHANVY